MRRLIALAAIALAIAACSSTSDAPDNLGAIQFIQEHRGGQEVTVEGTVAKVLPPSSTSTGEHERFLLDVHTGSGDEQLILIAHNTDIAPEAPVSADDDVIVRGVLEIDQGGPVIHWTHHDPAGRHLNGFIKAHGQTYE
jgi:hypothetical protein